MCMEPSEVDGSRRVCHLAHQKSNYLYTFFFAMTQGMALFTSSLLYTVVKKSTDFSVGLLTAWLYVYKKNCSGDVVF